jgi:hypothetical protein
MTEQEYLDYMQRHGFALDPTLTMRDAGRGIEPESALLAFVRTCALHHGYLFYHVFNARRSDPGYPDVTLAKPGRLIFAELKSATGKLTQEQTIWLDMLRQTLPTLEVYCWRPADRDTIGRILAGEHKE